MGLYHENGYLNMPWIRDRGFDYNGVITSRQVGKTYGTLKMFLEDKSYFLLFRRRSAEIDTFYDPTLFPFNKLNKDLGRDIHINKKRGETGKGMAMHFCDEDDREIGMASALSTFSNLRGFDGSRIDTVMFDEFIKEPHVARIKEEASAFFNALITINSNRELNGLPPVKVYFFGNPFELSTPILERLDLVDMALKLNSSLKDEIYSDRERSLTLIFPHESPITKRQLKETSVARLLKGTDTAALYENRYSDNVSNEICVKPLQEYIPRATIDGVYYYKHKSKFEWYGTRKRSGTFKEYSADAVGIRKFRAENYKAYDAYLRNRMYFSEYSSELSFKKIFKLDK